MKLGKVIYFSYNFHKFGMFLPYLGPHEPKGPGPGRARTQGLRPLNITGIIDFGDKHHRFVAQFQDVAAQI